MLKSQPYYFEDIAFQLELNLQTIRRELIKLLDEYHHNDCFRCNRIKCCCGDGSHSSFKSTTLTNKNVSGFQIFGINEIILNNQDVQAPSAEHLPKPEWIDEKRSRSKKSNHKYLPTLAASLDAWVRASLLSDTSSTQFPLSKKILDQINLSWPPFAKSIWSDEKARKTSEMENRFSCESERETNSSVQDFFRYFSDTKRKPMPKQCASC